MSSGTLRWKSLSMSSERAGSAAANLRKASFHSAAAFLPAWAMADEAAIAERARTFAEAYDDIEANVREQVAAELYAKWIDRLKAGSYIVIGKDGQK